MKTGVSKKLTIKVLIYFTVGLAAAIIGCHKEIEKLGQPPSTLALANHGVNIAMLQNAYNKGVNTNGKLKTTDVSQQTLSNIINSLTVDWTSYALFSYPDSTQVIEFSMPDDTSLLVPGQLAVHDSVKYQSKTTAVFIINKDTVTMSFFMKTIEDGTAPGYQSVLNQLHYKQIPNTFTGNVLYFSLSRQYLNGYTWNGGNITKAISIGAGASQPPQTPVSNSTRKLKTDELQLTNCVENDYELYSLTISGGEITYAEYIGTISVTTCDIVDTGGGSGGSSTTISGGGGASGDTTTPNNNPCTPVATVPAVESVKGKLVVDVAQGGSSGGNSGGASNPCVPNKTAQKVTNNLKNPCANKVLDDLINDDLNGEIAGIIKNVFGSSVTVNLDFEESSTTTGNAPAQSAPPVVTTSNGTSTFNETITLNSGQISGASQEYLASIMVHEIMHAYLNYNGAAQNQLLQHLNIAQNFVSGIRDILQQEYDIDNNDANSLIIEGLSDLQTSPLYNTFYNNLLSSLQLTPGLIQTTSLLYKDGVSGTTCN